MAAFSPSRTFPLRGILLAAALMVPCAAGAQTAPTNPQKPCTAPCTPPASDAPDAAPSKKFPYPGESKPAPQTTSPDVPDAPTGAQTPAAPNAAPAKQFPYPGESRPADSGGSSSSSSGSSSSSDSLDPSANPAAANADDDTPTDKFPRRRLPKVRNLQTDDERENEDLTVAKFYRSKGNWNAAYLRSKDAVKHGPDDPDAHLLLAESALKLNKKDEAAAEYNALLKLDASEDQVKKARKGLEALK